MAEQISLLDGYVPAVTKPKNISVYRLILVKEGTIPYETDTINKPKQAYEIIKQHFYGADREMLVVACLNTKNKVIAINTVSVGTLDSSLAHPREVFKTAILKNAANIILAHNHPSNDLTPSSDDKKVTQRIYDAGKILGIELQDHIIVGENDFYSFRENGDI